MEAHRVTLRKYRAEGGILHLGTAGSRGYEKLQVTLEEGWQGLKVQVAFHPCGVAVQLPPDGVVEVPWEATARPLDLDEGRIVFRGFDQDRMLCTADLAYSVTGHSPAEGRAEQAYTPGLIESALNEIAGQRTAAEAAASRAETSADSAAARAEAAREQAVQAAEKAEAAADAQQQAGAAQTQAASSASAAAADAASASNSAAAAAGIRDNLAAAVAAAGGTVIDPTLTVPGAAAEAKAVASALEQLARAAIRPAVTGNPAVCENSAVWGLQGLTLYGKSTQDGTPSPDNPVPIASAGDHGTLWVNVSGVNRIDYFKALDAGYSQKCDVLLNGDVFAFTPTEDGDAYFGGYIIANVGATYPSNRESLLFSVVPGTKIKAVASNSYFKTKYYCFLDSNKKVVSFSAGNAVTVPENAAFATARIGNVNAKVSDGTQYTTFMVCQEEYNGDFVPYQGTQTLTLSTPDGLPGIPVESGGNYTDADGQQWVCDVVDTGAGTLTQNVLNVTLDGSKDELWNFLPGTTLGNRYSLILDSSVAISDTSNVNSLNSNLPLGASGATYSEPYCYTIGINASGNASVLYVSLSGAETLDEYKAYLQAHPMRLLVRLATPITTPLSPEELAAYRALTTYDGTTVVSTPEQVSGMEVQYLADGTRYLQSVTDRIAALEQGRG